MRANGGVCFDYEDWFKMLGCLIVCYITKVLSLFLASLRHVPQSVILYANAKFLNTVNWLTFCSTWFYYLSFPHRALTHVSVYFLAFLINNYAPLVLTLTMSQLKFILLWLRWRRDTDALGFFQYSDDKKIQINYHFYAE